MSVDGRALPAWKHAEKDRVDYPIDTKGWDHWYADPAYGWTPASAAVREELDRAPAGRALDLGAGDGRHAVWLAGRGWQVDAVDFSPQAIRIGRERSAAEGLSDCIQWSLADVTTFNPAPASVDLVLAAFLHIPGAGGPEAITNAAQALKNGGLFLYIGLGPTPANDPRPEPDLPFTVPDSSQVAAWFQRSGLRVERAETRPRPIPGSRWPARDCVVLGRAHAPAAAPITAANDPSVKASKRINR